MHLMLEYHLAVSHLNRDCRAVEQSEVESARCSTKPPKPPRQAEQLMRSWAPQSLTLAEQRTLLGPNNTARPIACGTAPILLS
eukprot:5392366-Pyramimonas_sp.AAC.1